MIPKRYVFILTMLCYWPDCFASTARLDPKSGPNDGVYQGIIAASINTKPEVYPGMGVWLRGPDMPYLAAVFPGAADLRIDGWMYESCTAYFTFAGVTVSGENQLEVRHAFKKHPDIIHLTRIKAEPEAIELTGSLEVKTSSENAKARESLAEVYKCIGSYWPWLSKAQPDRADLAPDLCCQVMRSPLFQADPVEIPRNSAEHAPNYWKYVQRCFTFTDQGVQFLDKIPRTEIYPKHPDYKKDDPRNNPPLAQVFYGHDHEVPQINYYISRTTYQYPIMGAVSKDGKYLLAVAAENPEFIYQGWLDCVHVYPRWEPAGVFPLEQGWRLKIYMMKNDPDALLKRVLSDFPGIKKTQKTADKK